MKALIPVAGLGTHSLPLTKTVPKELYGINNIPVVQYVIEEAVSSGVFEVCLITSRRKKEAFEKYFSNGTEFEKQLEKRDKLHLLKELNDLLSKVKIEYAIQDEQHGLGHAILCAEEFINEEPFAVLLGDDIVDSKKPCLQQMLEYHNKYNASIIAVERVEKKSVSKYGIVDGSRVNHEPLYKLKNVVEKPKPEEAPSNLGISGRYVLTPAVIDILKNIEPHKGEIQLTDALTVLCKQEPVYALEFEGIRYDDGREGHHVALQMKYLKNTEEFEDILRKDKELSKKLKSIINKI